MLEAGKLAANGYKEIVVCGVCLGDYGRGLEGKIDLASLIQRLEDVPGLVRVRLSSIEVGDVTERLMAALSRSKKFCHHLHIPLQSGDDGVLADMNRRYKAADFLKAVRALKNRMPDISVTTDVIVGFPSETESAFSNTIALIEKIMPLKTHIFPFSSRAGTAAAARFRRGIPPAVVKERLRLLQKVSRACGERYKKTFFGKQLTVLVEARVKDKPGYWEGYTGNYIKVRIKSRRSLANRLVPVKLLTPTACHDIVIGTLLHTNHKEAS